MLLLRHTGRRGAWCMCGRGKVCVCVCVCVCGRVGGWPRQTRLDLQSREPHSCAVLALTHTTQTLPPSGTCAHRRVHTIQMYKCTAHASSSLHTPCPRQICTDLHACKTCNPSNHRPQRVASHTTSHMHAVQFFDNHYGHQL